MTKKEAVEKMGTAAEAEDGDGMPEKPALGWVSTSLVGKFMQGAAAVGSVAVVFGGASSVAIASKFGLATLSSDLSSIVQSVSSAMMQSGLTSVGVVAASAGAACAITYFGHLMAMTMAH